MRSVQWLLRSETDVDTVRTWNLRQLPVINMLEPIERPNRRSQPVARFATFFLEGDSSEQCGRIIPVSHGSRATLRGVSRAISSNHPDEFHLKPSEKIDSGENVYLAETIWARANEDGDKADKLGTSWSEKSWLV